MSRFDDLECVVRLACLTEHRDSDEQRALLAVAARVESELNKSTTRNMTARWGQPASTLTDLVEDTYVPEGRRVSLPKATREKLVRRRERWVDAHEEAIARRWQAPVAPVEPVGGTVS